jgi:PAS domain S-box-containing protein
MWDYNLVTGKFYIDIHFFDEFGFSGNYQGLSLKKWLSVLHPESNKDFARILRNLSIGVDLPPQWEYQIIDRNDQNRWVTAKQYVVEKDSTGSPARIVGIHTITDTQKRITLEQEENTQTLKGFIDNSLDGLIIIDEKGLIQEWNPAQARITQIKREQAIGKFIWDLQHSLLVEQKSIADFITDIDILFTKFSQSGNKQITDERFESKIRLKNDDIRIIQHYIFTIKTPMGIKLAIVNSDITESRNSISRIGKNEERLKLALAASNVGIWDIDLITGESYFSPHTYTLLGYRPLEVDPSDELWRSVIYPDDREWVTQRVRSFVTSGNNLDLELRAVRKDGEVIWINSKTRIIRDERNKSLRVTGSISDITRQKNVELNLRQNEEALKRNLQQHGVVSEISYILNTNLPFNQKIDGVLALLGLFTQASRVYVFENNLQNKTTANTFEWCQEGVSSQMSNLQNVPLEMVEGWSKDKDIMMSHNLQEDLPSDFADILISQDIQSFIIFRLQVNAKKFGYIGFDECNYKRIWTAIEIELLKTISNLISFAYERELIQKHYENNETGYRELTEFIDQIVFEVSPDGKIDFLNNTGCKQLGVGLPEIKKGLYIWHFLSLREVAKLKALSKIVAQGTFSEPINVDIKSVTGAKTKFTLYLRPRMERGEIVNFTGVGVL